MNDLIKQHLSKIETISSKFFKDIARGLRVCKTGSLELYLSEQLDTDTQEQFKTAIQTINPELTSTFNSNLDEFDEPLKYKHSITNKVMTKNASIYIHLIREPKSLGDMFSDLENS